MEICVNFGWVFVIGPLFREEYSFTHMYLWKFVGLDLEIEITEDYFEVLYNQGTLFTIFERLDKEANRVEIYSFMITTHILSYICWFSELERWMKTRPKIFFHDRYYT